MVLLCALAVCVFAPPKPATAFLFDGTELGWFWWRTPERTLLLPMVRTLPTVHYLKISSYFLKDHWSINERKILPEFMRTGSVSTY